MSNDSPRGSSQNWKGGSNDRVLIYSMEHRAWWRPNSHGYTINRAEAGSYSRAEAQAIVDGSQGRNERIEALHEDEHVVPDRVFLEECRDRLRGLSEAIDAERAALRAYFDVHGAHHSQDDCPQDDTCRCPEHAPLTAAWERLAREQELADRRLHRLHLAVRSSEPAS